LGIGIGAVELLIKLQTAGYLNPGATIVEIGAQQLASSFLSGRDRVLHLGNLLGIDEPLSLSLSKASPTGAGTETDSLDPAAPLARDFWRWLGFKYAAIDIDGSPGAIPLDLNYDSIPEKEKGKYDIATNFGTTEHVANQLNAFKIIHDLVAPNGLMIHTLPTQGMLNHGLVNYNFKFFWMLARSNGYKFIHADFTPSREFHHLPDNIMEFLASNNPAAADRSHDYKVADAGMTVVMQKSFDIAFVPPLDVNTGTSTEIEVLKKRYWTVFEPNAFGRLQSRTAPASDGNPPHLAAESRLSVRARWLGAAMRPLRTLKRMVHNSDATVRGIANQSDLLNRKFDAILAGIANQSDLINRKLEVLIQIMDELRKSKGRN
jgi:hypothetical protein